MSVVVPVSIGSLLLSEVIEDVLYKDEGLCVLGIFGKSSMQPAGPPKETLLNTLADKHLFPLFSGGGGAGPPEHCDPPEGGSLIQAYYSQENRVLYLMLTSVCDNRQLLRACESLSAGVAHADAQDFWKGTDRQHCLQLLYLFSLCHVMLLVHPNCSFDVTYDRLFRALDALRQKILPLVRAAIKDCPVSKEWKLNCRPCPPRLLFVFHMNGTLKVSGGNGDSSSSSAGGGGATNNHNNINMNPDKPKKHSPRRRLQHALEDQIYRIFRKSRVLTNQSSNCLFTVPANQAFVYVIPGADEDPVGALVAHLRSNCALQLLRGEGQDGSGNAPPAGGGSGVLSGPRRYQQTRRSVAARQPYYGVDHPPGSMMMSSTVGGGMGGAMGGGGGGQLVDCSLKEFLWQHIELVLTKKGFDDSVGRNPQPAHFELPNYGKWALVAHRLHQVMISNTEEETSELALKVQSQLKVLETFLDADAKFSENRCQKALPLAHSAYQSNLPHNYTTAVHKNQLAAALRVYSQHARGVAFQRYAVQLHEDCYAFWSNGHQLCEERSLSDQHCVHKFHLLPQPGEKPEMDRNPPILNHNSRGRSTSSCNCGRKQAPREDPFDIQAANYDFYQMLEEKCCGKLERIQFPVFQPSTPDPAPAAPAAAACNETTAPQQPPCPPGPLESSSSGGDGGGERLKDHHPSSSSSSSSSAASTAAAVATAVATAGTAAAAAMAHSHTPGDATTSLSLALSLGQSTDSLGAYGDGVVGSEAQQVPHKRPSLVDRQPSTVEYLPGMLHSGCLKGLLPKFSSWSLVRLGPAKAYNPHAGLEQPGFLPGSSFLLPWDLVIRSSSSSAAAAQRSSEDDAAAAGGVGGGGGPGGLDSGDGVVGGPSSSWPAPNKALLAAGGKRGSAGGGAGLGGGGDRRSRRRDDVARVFVGFEYEDSRGRRFLSSGPDKIVKVLGPGGPKEPATRVLNTDMPLYIPSPAQGRGLKPHYAQLTRLFVVVPDVPLDITLNPQVQPGPPPCPVFYPEQSEIVLPPDGLWVLRFPCSYVTERGPCYPPKENQPLNNHKVLRGILRATTTSPTPAPAPQAQ